MNKSARIKLRMGKKAFASEPLPFALSLLAFAFLAFAFFMLLSIPSCSNKTFTKSITSSESLAPTIYYTMDVFMRTPIQFDMNNDGANETITFADLIVWSANNKNYDILEEKLGKFFDSTNFYYVISISESDLGNLVELKKFRRPMWKRTGSKYTKGEFALPNYADNGKVIILQYSLDSGDSALAIYDSIRDDPTMYR